ncbi:MAG TPA: BCD family MFS transporter [Spirochaetia bacterium]|nr:BCD family MFS transporter [Spirochaetia bacterium]
MESYKFGRLLRLSTFQIGSALGDIVVTGIWNRIMISTYHVPAVIVGLLIAIRYLLAPIAMWAGYKSDRSTILGLRRSPFIWAGRALMVISLPLLVLSVGRFAAASGYTLGWLSAVVSALLYGTGSLISGGPYLALVFDSVPRVRRGFALSVAETSLIVWSLVCAALIGRLMPNYTFHSFALLVAAITFISAFFWSFSTMAVELPDWDAIAQRTRRTDGPPSPSEQAGFRETFTFAARDRSARIFFVFLFLATCFAWIQNAVLEPFGADLFHLTYGRIIRFNSFWQTAAIAALLVTSLLLRRRPPELQKPIAKWGLYLMAAGTAVLAIASFSRLPAIEIALTLFGLGFGAYTFGGLSLMAAMSPSVRAGSFLGLWSIVILLAKGAGTLVGGVLRDFCLDSAHMTPSLSYGLVFVIETFGLAAAALIVTKLDVVRFSQLLADEPAPPDEPPNPTNSSTP